MSWPPRFLFSSSRLSLDLAHTGGEGKYAHFERLLGPDDLRDWFAESSLCVAVERVTLLQLVGARRLRGAIWNGAQDVCHGRPIAADMVREIERFAARPDLVPALRAGESALEWAAGSSAAQALSSVARDALHLFGGPARERLRKCENPRCPLLFVDTSRPGRRRWCTMRRCGNLEKTARYRESLRQAEQRRGGRR